MLTAIAREPSAAIQNCEVTFLKKEPIDVALALRQHRAYRASLSDLGVQVVNLPSLQEFPDSVFVEDVAVVVDEVAVITRPGSSLRRAEAESIVPVLADYRSLRRIAAPGTLDGGDVMQVDRTVYVGLSRRTNEDGANQLRRFLLPFDYDVKTVPVEKCLHLKSACTYLGEGTLLIDPSWIDRTYFDSLIQIEIDPSEPFAANALRINDVLIYPDAFLRTGERLERGGFRLDLIDTSELRKAEAGVTCQSLVFRSAKPGT